MVAFDYAAKAATALRLLTKYGQAVTLRVSGAAVYDPNTQTSTPVQTDYPRIGAVFDYTFQHAGETLQNGTMAMASDRQCWLSSGTIKPPVSSQIVLADGSLWTIADVKATDPSGVAVVYECRIRQ